MNDVNWHAHLRAAIGLTLFLIFVALLLCLYMAHPIVWAFAVGVLTVVMLYIGAYAVLNS